MTTRTAVPRAGDTQAGRIPDSITPLEDDMTDQPSIETGRPYPPADDRLRHLLAQRINCHVDTWKLAFFIAGAVVDDPEIRREVARIVAAHTTGRPCGDRNCRHCFEAVSGVAR